MAHSGGIAGAETETETGEGDAEAVLGIIGVEEGAEFNPSCKPD